MSSPQVPEMLLTQEDVSQLKPVKTSAGQLLKQARQAKGVHLAVLAVTLKVPVRQLEALEADQYEAFKGGPTFLRAITASMCRHLGMDAAPVLALLPSAVSSMGVARPPLESLSGLQRVSLRHARGVHRSARQVLVLAALMLLGTAAFLWLPAPESWGPYFSTNDPAAPQVEEAAVPLGQASNPESSDVAAPAASAAQPFAPAPASPASAAVLPNTSGAAPTSWYGASEHSPALALRDTSRGQTIDSKAHAPQSVARIEVKE